MELLKDLELIEVAYENNGSKAVLTFLDEERGHIREINFNRQAYDEAKKTYVDNEEKAARVDEWCETYFSLPFAELTKAIGVKKDVYAYDGFNSLWESTQIEKFSPDDVGQVFEVTCSEIVDDGKAVRIRFEYEGKTYESKMSYATWNAVRGMWFVDPQKQKKQYEKFKTKFNIDIKDMQELVGKTLMVEIKLAMSKYVYVEVKPFMKKKR